MFGTKSNRVGGVATAVRGWLGGSSRPAPANRVRLAVESLEDRSLMSASPITDMTQWAQQFGTQAHVQGLTLNFDGDHQGGSNIAAFVPQAGKDRDAAIQDILYRVSEIFSPFDVQVTRQMGDGVYSQSGGYTTIFIGGNAADVSTSSSGNKTKYSTSFTPFAYSDFGGPARGLDHAPNSDPFDLAYVDPMAYQGRGASDPARPPRRVGPTSWVTPTSPRPSPTRRATRSAWPTSCPARRRTS